MGGGCNNSSSDDDNPPVENPDDTNKPDDSNKPDGDTALFKLGAPGDGWGARPDKTHNLTSELNLEGKKLKVTVTGKTDKDAPAESASDGLKFVMVDADGKTSDEYALGWFGTAGKTLEGTFTPKDGVDTDWNNGGTQTPHNCDFTKIVALKFINYCYTVKADNPDQGSCVEGTGVAVTVNEVKYEEIVPETDVLFELDAPGDGWTDAAPYDYELKEATNLTGKKLIVTGKHYKEKPVEKAAAGLQCMFIDENGKEADQDACKLGWFTTEGSTLEVDCVAGDNAQEDFDLTKVKVLRFKNYSYTQAADYSHEPGSGVALSVTNVEIK